MDLSFNPEEERFRERVRDFLRENLPPGWLDGGSRPPGTTQLEFLRQWQRRLYEKGFLGMAWPKEFGGQGASQI
jgi:alkylation response protein AidB-like acyl-CoA dehydrogenase